MKLRLIASVLAALSFADATADTIGEKVYAPSGKLLGKEIIETNLKGTWFGLATSLEVVNGIVKRTDAAHLVCFLESDGSMLCDAQHSGTDGMLKNEIPWTGQLYYLTNQVYMLVNGDQNADSTGCALYEVQFNRAGDSLNATLLAPGECDGVTKVFWEMNHFVKVSDEIDYSMATDVLEVTDQWVRD